MHVNCAVVTRLSSLQWRHTLSNHRHLHCLLNCWFRRRSKKTSKFHVAGVRGIHQWWVNSPHKRPVTRNMFPFDDVIMSFQQNSVFYVITPVMGVTLKNLNLHRFVIVFDLPYTQYMPEKGFAILCDMHWMALSHFCHHWGLPYSCQEANQTRNDATSHVYLYNFINAEMHSNIGKQVKTIHLAELTKLQRLQYEND